MYCHSTGLLVLRLLLAAVFIYHVIPKFSAPEGLVAFIWWAPMSIGLDFLSASGWFYLAIVGELFIILTALIGLWTRAGAVVTLVVLFFAMVAKKWGAAMSVELDLVLAWIAIVLFIAGPGRYSVSAQHRNRDGNHIHTRNRD